MGNPQSHHRHWTDFPVGSKVRTVCAMQDMRFFPAAGLTGTVSQNEGRYLSIIVAFDNPRRFWDSYYSRDNRCFDRECAAPGHDHVKPELSFNFNPSDLLLLDEEWSPDTVKEEQEWRDLGDDDPFVMGYWTSHNEPPPSPMMAPSACSTCGEQEVVRLPDDWQDRVLAGVGVPVIACGSPFHYANVGLWT